MKKIIALLLMFGVLFTANAVTSTRTVSIEFDVDKPTTMSFNISNVVQGDPLTINWAAKEGSEAADLSLVDGIKFYIKDYPESSIIAHSNAIITNPTNGVGTVSFISQQMRFENYVANVEIVAQFGDLNERTLAQGLINLSQQFVTGTEDNWNPPTGYTLGQALLSGNNAQGLDIENLDDILLNRILLTNTDVISAGIWSSSRDISVIPRDKFDVTGEIEADSITVLSTIDLPDKSITNRMIADNAITSSKFEAGSVGDDALADTLTIPYLSISGGLTLPAGDIVASDIGEGQVNTFHIEDNSITANDLATNSVGDLELQDSITINSLTVPGSISIPAASIGPEEIALSAIYSSHIADNTITQDDIADDAVGSGELQDTIEVANLSVTNNISIPKNSIGNNELVDSIQLSWLEVTDIIDIPLGSIGTDDIASDIEIRNLTVSESISLPPGVNIDLELGAGSVGTAELADDAVTVDKLADNAVVSSNIVDGSISDVDLANDYIRADVDDSVSGTLTLTKPTLLVEQSSSPGAPQPGFAMVYALDNNLYYKNDQGAEYSLIATGGGGGGGGTLEETLLLGNNANGQSITGLASLSSGTIEVDGVLYADTIVSKNQVSTYDNTLTDSYLYGERHVLEAVRGNSLDYTAGTHEEAGESTAIDSMISIKSFGSNEPLVEITGSKIYDGLFNIYDSTGGSFFMWSNQSSDSDKVAVIDIGENDSWIPVKGAFGGVGVSESGGNVFGSIPDASADGENSAIGWSYKPSNTFFGKENVTTFVDGTGKEGSYAVNGVDAIDDASITMGLFKPLVNQDGNTTFDSSVGDFFLTREYITKEDFSAIYNSGSGINPFAYTNPEHLLVYYAGNGEPSNYYDGDYIDGFYSWPYSANIIGDKWSAGEDYLWNTNAIPVSGSVINNPPLWLDASTLLRGTPDGGDVSVWEDRSGNGYNATSISGIDALLDYDGIGGMASVTFTTNTVYKVDSGLTYARNVYSVTDGIAPEFIRNAIRIDDGSGDNAIWSGDGFAIDPIKLGHVAGVANMLDGAYSVAVSPDGNYVYVAALTSDSMVIIDVTDKNEPVRLGHVATFANKLNGATSVAVSPDGNYVYATSNVSNAMAIIDVTDKNAPVKLGHVDGVANLLGGAVSVAVSPDGNYVYAAASDSNAMVIIDVTDKNAPVKLGHVAGAANMLDGARSVSVSPDGNYVYVAAYTSNAMVIIDVTDKNEPVRLGHVAGAANRPDIMSVSVSPDGNYVYVAELNSDAMVIIDVADKNAPVRLGRLAGAANMLDAVRSVAVSPDGNYVYAAANSSDSMVIIDVTDKNAPVKLGHVDGVANMLDGAISVAVSPDGNYVYVAAVNSDSVVIIDIFKGIVYDGNISEIVTSGNNLSNDDSYKIEGYLANKYSISLPEGHVYKYHAPFAPKFGTTVQLFNTVDGIMEASGTATPNSDIAGFPVTVDDGKSTVRAYINDGYIDTDGYRAWDDDPRTFVVTTGASGEVVAGVKNIWLPSMLGEDVVLWLDAYSLIDIYDNGDEVTLWEDRFIGAYEATVPTASYLYEKYISLPDGDAKSSLVAEFGKYIESEIGVKIIEDDPIIDDPIIDDPIIDDPIIDDPIIKEPILNGEGLDTGDIEGGDTKPMSAEATSPTGPTFIIDGLNGKPTLMFDGTEFMVVSDLTLSSDATIFTVSNAAALSPLRDNPLFGATEAYFEYSTSSAAQYGIHMDSISGVTSASDYSADNIASVVWDAGASLALYRNGELVGIDEAVSVSTSFTSLELGRYIGNYHTGDLSEIIIFDRALTTTERQMVEGYLGNKYGISLISGHPYESEAPEGGSGALNQFQVMESMISNGNFEAWSAESPSAWTASNVTKETSYVHSGNNSARLDASLGGSTLESSPVQMQSGAYALTCMARSDGSGGVLRLGWNNDEFSQAYCVGHNHVDKSLTNKWERMSFVTALSNNILSGSFVAEATSGVVYIDDVSVVRLADLSPKYTPGGIGWRGFNGIGEISGWVYAPFVGTHDKLTADARDINGKEGSISIWISPYDDIPTPGHVFECGDLKVTRLADGTIKAIANGGDVESVSTSVIAKGEWSNIVIVWDESSQYLYVDGVLEDTDAISSDMDLVNTIHIGTGVDGNGFGGYIANVAFWDRALTADQALAVATSNHAVVGQIAPTEKPLRRVAKYIALNDIQRGDAVILIDGETVSTTSSVDNPLFEGIATDNAIAGDYVWVGVGGVFEANSSAEINVGDYLGTSIIDGELAVTSTPPTGSSSAIAVSVAKDGNVSVLIR